MSLQNYSDRNEVQIGDKHFKLLFSHHQILEKVKILATSISLYYKDIETSIHLLVVMNGAFIFAADLVRHLDQRFILHFVKFSSYEGINQSKEIHVDQSINFNNFANQNVLIVEDIIESGRTVGKLIQILQLVQPKSLHTISLIIKPDSVIEKFPILAKGFEIGNEFVVGYGMDYCHLGRGLKDIYQIIE